LNKSLIGPGVPTGHFIYFWEEDDSGIAGIEEFEAVQARRAGDDATVTKHVRFNRDPREGIHLGVDGQSTILGFVTPEIIAREISEMPRFMVVTYGLEMKMKVRDRTANMSTVASGLFPNL